MNKFRDSKVKDLRIPRASAPFRGTTRYASISALSEKEQSRKDDIEACLNLLKLYHFFLESKIKGKNKKIENKISKIFIL